MGDDDRNSSRDDDDKNKASPPGFLRVVTFRQMLHRWQPSSSSATTTNAKRSGESEQANEPSASTNPNNGAAAVAGGGGSRDPLRLPRVVEERGAPGHADGGGDSPMTPMTPDAAEAAPADVPRGCCPVYVGAERRRFVVPTAYLGMPVFRRLLEKAEEEFEFHYVAGAVTIPCDTEAFKYILLVMDRHARGLVDDEGNSKDGEQGHGGSSSSQQVPMTSSTADGGVTDASAKAIVLDGTDDAVGNCSK